MAVRGEFQNPRAFLVRAGDLAGMVRCATCRSFLLSLATVAGPPVHEAVIACACQKVCSHANPHIPTRALNGAPAVNSLCRSADGDVVRHVIPARLKRMRRAEAVAAIATFTEVGRLVCTPGRRTVHAARRSYR